jgi:hypothetical protein
MNLQTVITNLKQTIAGKEEALALFESRRDIPRAPGDQMAVVAAIEFLEINIAELKRILADLEQCRPEWTPHNCPYAANETCHRMD